MNNIEYLLKYISQENYDKLINSRNDYMIEMLDNNYIDVRLNIEYLIKYGISNIEEIICSRIEDMIMNHDDFIKKINEYEKKHSKEDVIMLLENI